MNDHPLRRYRREHGLKQAQLGALVGADYSTISRIERGQQTPGRDLLFRIADLTGISVDDLLGRVPPSGEDAAA